MKILMVLTSTGESGEGKKKTGTDIQDLCTAYYALKDAGAEIILTTPKGGLAPIDPVSLEQNTDHQQVCRYHNDAAFKQQLADTIRLGITGQFFYDGALYPGGSGVLRDLMMNDTSLDLVANFYKHHKPIAFIGHGIAALLGVLDPWGKPLLKEKKIITPVKNASDPLAVLAINKIESSGAQVLTGPVVIHDDILITAQQGSAGEAATLMLKMLATGSLTHVFPDSFQTEF